MKFVERFWWFVPPLLLIIAVLFPVFARSQRRVPPDKLNKLASALLQSNFSRVRIEKGEATLTPTQVSRFIVTENGVGEIWRETKQVTQGFTFRYSGRHLGWTFRVDEISPAGIVLHYVYERDAGPQEGTVALSRK